MTLHGWDLIRILALLPVVFLAGCPVTQSQDVPVPALDRYEPLTSTPYRLYVPSNYTPDRRWPLVVTLHGTFGFDGPGAQVNEWKALAELHGFIVAAPRLRSVQGILPRIKGLWFKDLESDERSILAVMDHVAFWYKIDPKAVLLTGFSAGGFPMYWTGLRNPQRFAMLVARACNCDIDLFERIPPTAQARKLPIFIYCGQTDLSSLREQTADAYWHLRLREFNVTTETTHGGHFRSPEVAWKMFQPALPHSALVSRR